MIFSSGDLFLMLLPYVVLLAVQMALLIYLMKRRRP